MNKTATLFTATLVTCACAATAFFIDRKYKKVVDNATDKVLDDLKSKRTPEQQNAFEEYHDVSKSASNIREQESMKIDTICNSNPVYQSLRAINNSIPSGDESTQNIKRTMSKEMSSIRDTAKVSVISERTPEQQAVLSREKELASYCNSIKKHEKGQVDVPKAFIDELNARGISKRTYYAHKGVELTLISGMYGASLYYIYKTTSKKAEEFDAKSEDHNDSKVTYSDYYESQANAVRIRGALFALFASMMYCSIAFGIVSDVMAVRRAS